eukprot:gene10886-biopygen13680
MRNWNNITATTGELPGSLASFLLPPVQVLSDFRTPPRLLRLWRNRRGGNPNENLWKPGKLGRCASEPGRPASFSRSVTVPGVRAAERLVVQVHHKCGPRDIVREDGPYVARLDGVAERAEHSRRAVAEEADNVGRVLLRRSRLHPAFSARAVALHHLRGRIGDLLLADGVVVRAVVQVQLLEGPVGVMEGTVRPVRVPWK